ncbi:MAG: NAD(P)H-dependent glycerol-3-phosphate dehydrogenase [Peptostreptococcaceae bacterium]|nr:NAD(P)H-dependent glycerol-3-phosphate dehydrogenase [Peptostreptococcaceae bacterium]
MSRVAVLGSGSWGTALARTFALNGNDVILWGRDKKQIDRMKLSRINSKYLEHVMLPENIHYTDDIFEAVKGSDVLLLAVSSQANRSILEKIKSQISERTIIVNVSKGLEKETNKRASEICKEILPKNPFVVLSGPSHAEEVALSVPTTLVASSDDLISMECIQSILSNEFMRVYTNRDVIGVELGGALKNIIALGIGIIDGLGFGDNTKAAMMTRGMTEIVRLGVALGAEEATFFGLTGMGDLIVTCTSVHSRNRRAGILIGQGKKLEEIHNDIHMVVEGITSTQIAFHLSKKMEIEMPIVQKMFEVIYQEKDPKEAIRELMTRRTKHENEDILDLH